MTRLWLMSDLHDDYSRHSMGNLSLPRDVEADVLVIAGDVAGRFSRMGRAWLESQWRGMPMVVVPGNHCVWRASVDVEVRKFRDRLQVDWIHVLDGDAVEIAGVRFVGGTLWTDYAIFDGNAETGAAAAEAGMNDFRYLRTEEGSRRARAWNLARIHQRHRAAIDATLSVPFDGPSVVVTHHAPSAMSLRTGSVREPLDAAYASDLEDLILRRRPDLWVHGHVHESRDYRIGSTRVVCNPRGYVSRIRKDVLSTESTGFDPRLVVEV